MGKRLTKKGKDGITRLILNPSKEGVSEELLMSIENIEKLTEVPIREILMDVYGNKQSVIGDAVEKLCEYEDMEETGLLLKLPCKEGTLIYQIDGIEWKGYPWKYRNYDKAYVTSVPFKLNMLHGFGTSYFLTPEEAEEELQNLKDKQISDPLQNLSV